MSSDDDRERLKSALWYYVGKTVDDKCLATNRNATPQYIGALTELLWTQIENVAVDLETFANHAGRKNITTEDVMLLARKNPDLQQLMRDFVSDLPAPGASGAPKRTASGKAKGKAVPAQRLSGKR